MSGTAAAAQHNGTGDELFEETPTPLMQWCVCPRCHGSLLWSPQAAECSACGQRYPRDEGIPDFTSFDEDSTDEDVRYKLDQAEFFDTEGAEWEISRPHGSPALYGWLMAEKFRRSVAGLEELLPGAMVLTVCGGSGMDAEFLARAGAHVIASDISMGAAKRARERARRHGVAIFPIVADVEQLPFADKSLDIAYVHDGLHHLGDPMNGLAEMLRVASRAVSITEPVRAVATQLAVRVGLALSIEDAGNRVERVDPTRIVDLLQSNGFRCVGNRRYAMFYRHEPGVAMRVLSRRRLFPLAAAGLGAFNRSLGPRLGNKGAVQAVLDAE